MRAVDLIGKKRSGHEHTRDEISFLIRGYVNGSIPDYQISAWLMAVVWRGLSETETFALTTEMVASGDVLDLGDLAAHAVDKHSTGGVGDKTTLAVAPILAAGGVIVAKMSGRGLGHTGGTLDKLGAVPGMRTSLRLDEIVAQVRTVGACIAAQTAALVPADSKLYALRDATNTVESLPLIAASIMSKKLASGAHNIILDVKVGSGAFMKTVDDGRALAAAMIAIGKAHGRRVIAVLTDMNIPLGYNVGNLVEVKEIVSLLRGHAFAERRLYEAIRYLSALGFVMSGKTETLEQGEALAVEMIRSGRAMEKLTQIVAAQGGDSSSLLQTLRQPNCRVKLDVVAPRSGYLQRVDAEAVGIAAVRLGAGRATKDDKIDPTAGVMLRHTVGEKVTKGNAVATVCASSEVQAREAAHTILQALVIGDEPVDPSQLIYETIGL